MAPRWGSDVARETPAAVSREAPAPHAPHAPAARLWPGLALAMAGSVAFSGKAIIVKLAYRYGVDAVTLIMYRMLFALPFFLVLAARAGRGRPPLSRSDRWLVAGLGFSGYYLASFLDFAGLAYVSASFERLILYLNPTLVLLLGRVLYGRRVTRAQVGALLVSYAGVCLVFGHELRLAGSHVVLGAALVFGSAVSYACYLVFSGEAVRRIGSLRLTGLASTVACVFCLAQFAALRPLSAAAVAPPVLALSLLNAVACTVAPVLMVMMAIERVGASVAAQTGMIGPVSTILMGVLILGEPFTGWVVVGTGAVLGGIWVLARGSAPARASAPSAPDRDAGATEEGDGRSEHGPTSIIEAGRLGVSAEAAPGVSALADADVDVGVRPVDDVAEGDRPGGGVLRSH
jgi:drug/metabolite transporter (DMT)-like permease